MCVSEGEPGNNSGLILEMIDPSHVKIKPTRGQSAGKDVWTKQSSFGHLDGQSI